MRTTPPRPPVGNRSSEELAEDLCVALRDVAVWERELPAGAHILGRIEAVRAVYQELAQRHVDVMDRLEELSEATSWQMRALLDDCLSFPETLPYVREADGVRRHLRCVLCGVRERPTAAKLFWFCDACMDRLLRAMRERVPIAGIMLFRTYNQEHRCVHADADTVLVAETLGYAAVDELPMGCLRAMYPR